jgi:phage gp36-like protein
MPVTIPDMTEETRMERKFGEYGLTSFSDHNSDGTRDTGVIDDCIEQASAEIAMLAGQRYLLTDLATHPLVQAWATTFAIYFLCQRRGNSIPTSLGDEFNRISTILEKIVTGEMKLPGLDEFTGIRPTLSNLTIDRRYPNNRVRVRTSAGSGRQTPSQLQTDQANQFGVFE